MSARHLQKPKQTNFKDGKFGTALLVTLAFDQPTSQALFNESYVPSTWYADPPPSYEAGAVAAPPCRLLNALHMYRFSEVPDSPKHKWDWTSFRISCLLQIIQASYAEKNGIPLVRKLLGELYTTHELIECEALGHSQYSHSSNEYMLMEIIDQLVPALEEQAKVRWSEYKESHEVDKALPGPHGHLHQYFHAAQWLFARAPYKFLDEHRNQFVELARLLGRWTDMYVEVAGEDPLPSSWSLVADVAMNRDLTVGMEKALAKLDRYFKCRHHCNMSAFDYEVF
eukprot:Blabericola_migrator_1__1226@NODE_1314_length_4836_cov_33_074858_g884_i0_p1_GENE_NODE_1314_length_4836_cov_33_074858_g884_i0NODE_1314_length_4836_cov_33_074858_g884_i0_p1_ORF_typecomplete_len283_score29_73_NODE_1314_length_4836_cov_33_074858_g884_i021012949